MPHARRSRKSSTTVGEIAAKLGISKMTVSRALRGEACVAADTLARVQRTAERLKYRPNGLMRAVHTGRSRTVGVMVDPRSSFHSGVLGGIHQTLAAHDYLPILHYPHQPPVFVLGDRDASERAYLHRLLDQRVDGIIFWPSDETIPDPYLQEVWDRGVPLVAVDRRMPATHADFSGTDDTAGARLAADHLLDLGHRRLAFINAGTISTFVDRRRAFEERVMARAGATCCEVTCPKPVSTSCSETQWYDGGRVPAHCDSLEVSRGLLRDARRPTAILCACDWMALGVYTAAAEMGLVIGRDLSVIGFADLREASMLEPALTTVRQDAEAIGRTAAELILDRIEGRVLTTMPREMRQVPRLVERASTGPRGAAGVQGRRPG
jgi:LacI family transcriptional regulator